MADPFLAEIRLFAGNFAPKGWALCDGQLLPINQNQALFSILGTFYGGNGTTNFALPDLRGRVPVGVGQGPGLADYPLGQQTGTETATIAIGQMPPHTHAFTPGSLKIAAVSAPGNTQSPDNAFPAAEALGVTATYSTATPDITMAPAALSGTPTVATIGGGQPVGIMQPYVVLTYIIALVGIFPSRN
jgi:microcystin-dependent protein